MDKEHSKIDVSSTKRRHNTEIQTLLKNDDCNIQYGGVSTSEDISTIGKDNKYQSKCMAFYGILVTLTIEPVMFCFMFAYVMNLSIMTNMMMDKACLYHLNYSSEICNNLSAYEDEKTNVEILATDYSLYANLMSFIAAFLMLFIAPWSDKYGRKPPLLMSVGGNLLTDVGLIFCTVYFDSRLEYIILSRFPTEIFGGFICALTVIFSLASEQSSEKNRTLKYTVLEIALGVGAALGGLTSGFLYRYYGYVYVYGTVTVLHGFCFLWIVFIVEETTGLNLNMKCHEKAKDFFVCKSIKQGFTVTCKPRAGNTRSLLLLLLVSLSIIVLNYESFGSISYVYVHHVYNWDPTISSIVNTTAMLISFGMSLLFVPIFIRVFKFNDFTLGIIGTVSMILKNLFIAFSKYHTYIYYIGVGSGLFTSLSTLSIRTGISKLVGKDELGRVFAFLATCEAIIPIVGTIIVTKIFEATLDVFPNVTYTITVVWLLMPLGTFIWAWKTTKNGYNTLSVSANDHVSVKVQSK